MDEQTLKIIIGIAIVVICVPLFVISAIYKDDGVVIELDDDEKQEVEARLEKARQDLLEKEAKDVELDGKE